MIIVPVVLVAISIGVLLAALDGPYTENTARAARAGVLIILVAAATLAAGGALVMRDWSSG